MSELSSVDLQHFFIFVIPGFMTIWSFRYFTDSKKTGEFELFALSFFCGLVVLMFYELISSAENIKKLLGNNYSAAFILSISGMIISFLAAAISRTSWYKIVIKKLKSFKLINYFF